MPYCPNCGRHVALGDPECAECGQSVAEALAGGGDPGAGYGDEDGPREPPAADRPSMAADQSDPATRRKVLAGAGGILGAMVLGTFVVERLSGDGPVEAVDVWRRAWVTGDDDPFEALWHPEAAGRTDWPAGDPTRPAAPDPTLEYNEEDRSVLEQSDGRATVRDVFILGHPEFESRHRLDTRVELRTVSGDWRIWRERLAGSEPVTDCNRILSIGGSSRISCE